MELSQQEKQKLAMMLKKEQNCSLRKATQLLEEANWDYKKASKPKSIDLFSMPVQEDKTSITKEKPVKTSKLSKPKKQDSSKKETNIEVKATKKETIHTLKQKEEPIVEALKEENIKETKKKKLVFEVEKTSKNSKVSKYSKNTNEQPITESSLASSSKPKDLNLKTIKERIEATSGHSSGYSWDEYLLRCEYYSKHPKFKPVPPSCIGQGFTPMQEISAYASTLKQVVNESTEEKTLEKFNKQHKTNFKNWLEISRDYQEFTEEDLLEYKDQIKWYEWNKTHEEPQLSKKAAKVLREKFLIRITMNH